MLKTPFVRGTEPWIRVFFCQKPRSKAILYSDHAKKRATHLLIDGNFDVTPQRFNLYTPV